MSSNIIRSVLALIFVVGCAESEPSDSSPDNGQPQSSDTGMVVDASVPTEDATVTQMDAEVTADSGMEPDAILAPVDPIAIEDAAAALTTAVCDFSERCQLLELLELVVNDDCATFIEAQFTEGTLAGVQSSMDAGRVIYNGEAMARCVAELSSTSCGADLDSLFRACDAAFEGQQAAGDACEQSSECAGAQACVLNGGCPGRCGPLPEVGEACNDQTGCADDAVCFEERCVTPIGPNQTCREDSTPCASGLFCKTNLIFMTSACEPLNTRPVGLGATCDLNGGPFCSSGLSCVAQPPAVVIPGLPAIPEFKCLEKVGDGDVCYAGAPDQCSAGFYCSGFDLDDLENLDIEGICLALPNQGEPCATSLVGDICNRGLVCNGETCELRQMNGEVCAVNEECFGGSCTNSTCGPIVENMCQ